MNLAKYAICKKICLSVLLLTSIFISTISLADTTGDKILRVGIVDPIAPFVIANKGTYGGISTDVWQFVAGNEHIKYNYILLPSSTDDAIKLLQKGEIDVLIGPISVTSDRYNTIDFSYPYFLNSIGIVERCGATDFFRLVNVFIDLAKSPLFISFILLFIIYIHILWLFEKGRTQNFHTSYLPGITHIIWTHLLQKGFKELPHTVSGRLVSLIWVLMAAVFITAILATVTSRLTLTLVTKPEHFTRTSDLQDQFVAAVRGTHAYIEAKRIGANVVAADNLQQAMDWLDEKKVAAVAEDYILAKDYLNKHNYPQLHLNSITLSNDQYAIALPKNSPLLEKINHELLVMQDNDSTTGLCARYIGADSKLCKL